MAEFVKIREDGSCEKAPNPLKITISNPTDERYRYEGYLEKKYTPIPVYDPETEILIETWIEYGQYAVQNWTVTNKLSAEETE